MIRFLISMGRAIGFFLKWKNPSAVFFFFPFYHVGGAEKVHADIVACVADRSPWTFFTGRSKDRKLRPSFEGNARIFDRPFLMQNRFMSHIVLGVLAVVINRHAWPVVFGANSPFFYLLIEYLKPHVRVIDLLHAFGEGLEYVSLGVVSRITGRVVVNAKTGEDLREQYALEGIGAEIADRIRLIENTVAIPDAIPGKGINQSIQVLYVGRGTEEKRVHLVARAADRCQKLQIPAEFILVGEVSRVIEPQYRASCTMKGEVGDQEELAKLYRASDLLVLTSSREGFPMVIMEAMANGVVPVTTNVGGIPSHIKHRVNGILICDENEAQIVESLAMIVKELAGDRERLRHLSRNAHEYAREHFESSRFQRAYRNLILGDSGMAENHPGLRPV